MSTGRCATSAPAFDFAWTASAPADWREPWAGWPSTRYEAKARARGAARPILTFRRAPASGWQPRLIFRQKTTYMGRISSDVLFGVGWEWVREVPLFFIAREDGTDRESL